MSRSLVGSSSSSTLGSSISSRSSCSRRRSPPDRSPTGVHCASPVKPNRSHSWVAVIVRPLPRSTTRRDLLDGLEHPQRRRRARRGPGRGTPARTVAPALDRAGRRARASPASSRSSEVLPAPLTPTMPTRSPGPSRQVTCVEQHPARRPRRSTSSTSSTSLPSRCGGEPQQLDAVARRRLVGDQRVGGVDAELRLRRARRRPAAQPGELLADQVLPARLGGRGLPRRARPGRARTPRSRPRTRRTAPSCTSQVAVADLVEEPAVVGDDHERPRRGGAGGAASQATPSTSRWLVGSSRTSRSCSPSSSPGQRDPAALAAGQRPDDRSSTRRGRRRPPSSPSSTSRMRGVARPTRASARRRRRASRTVAVGSSVVALARASPTRRPPACVTRPASGASRRVEQPQQRGLAVAVAADDADPVALGDAERDAVEQGAGAVAPCATPSRLTRLRATQRVPDDAGARRPAPCARVTDRHVPGRGQRDGDVERVLRRRGRGTRRSGPQPETSAPSAPASSPASSVARSAGRSEQAAGCRSLCSARPERVGVAGAQRRHQRVGHARLGRPGAVAQPVELGVDLGRRQARRRRARPPSRTGPRASDRGQHARRGRCRARCRRAARTARRCRARRRASSSSVAAQAGAPERVAGDQGRGRVGAAAGQPAGDRDALADVQRARRRSTPVVLGEQQRGRDREVGARRAGTSSTSMPSSRVDA